MFETITVDDALKSGKKNVKHLSLFILFALIMLSAFIVERFSSPGIAALICFPAAFIIAWLYWGTSVVRWKLWAFENVRNVHELKQRAILEQVIPKDKGFLNKTEIWTSIQRDKWQSLQHKFDIPDLFEDDYTVAEETGIYYSKWQKLFMSVVMSVIAFTGLYLLTTNADRLIPIILIVVGALLTAGSLMQFFDRRAQIMISNQGITTIKKGFFSWEDISEEKLILERRGKQLIYYLTFNHPGGSFKTSVTGLDANHTKIDKLLRLYRSRHEAKANKTVSSYNNV